MPGRHKRVPDFPFAIGDNISDADPAWLLKLADHLHMLSVVARSNAVAQECRSSGYTEAALRTESLCELYMARLPSNWRW
jgi:hypothetical protein